MTITITFYHILILFGTLAILFFWYPFLYAVGNTIFDILHISPSKAICKPLIFIKVVVTAFTNGFIEGCFWPSSKVSTKRWTWEPLFKFARKEA